MANARPTLPPLHSLNLPRGDMHDVEELGRRLHISSPQPPSVSPQSTPCLRPLTNEPALTTTTAPMVPFPPPKFRLVPTSFENANAFIVVPPPSAPNAPEPKPLLFVGPALRHLRQPQHLIARGTRLHPYRIARPLDRRPTGSHVKTPQASRTSFY